MLYLRLFYEFFKTGLFAIGGGLATLPFLYEISEKTGWFSTQDISNMIAVSESTPGPIGINMSTYVGFHTAYGPYGFAGALLGGIIATLALVIPSLVIIEIISGFLKKFKDSTLVKNVFYSLRPASTALVAAAGLGVAKTALLTDSQLIWAVPDIFSIVNWVALLIGGLLFAAIRFFKFHPIVYIAASAVIGIVLQL